MYYIISVAFFALDCVMHIQSFNLYRAPYHSYGMKFININIHLPVSFPLLARLSTVFYIFHENEEHLLYTYSLTEEAEQIM